MKIKFEMCAVPVLFSIFHYLSMSHTSIGKYLTLQKKFTYFVIIRKLVPPPINTIIGSSKEISMIISTTLSIAASCLK